MKNSIENFMPYFDGQCGGMNRDKIVAFLARSRGGKTAAIADSWHEPFMSEIKRAAITELDMGAVTLSQVIDSAKIRKAFIDAGIALRVCIDAQVSEREELIAGSGLVVPDQSTMDHAPVTRDILTQEESRIVEAFNASLAHYGLEGAVVGGAVVIVAQAPLMTSYAERADEGANLHQIGVKPEYGVG